MFQGSHKNMTQFLETLFNGSVIDYYNISFIGAEETYSIVNTSSDLTWLQNVTSFNVTAHNCVGQSASVNVVVYISHGMCMYESFCGHSLIIFYAIFVAYTKMP